MTIDLVRIGQDLATLRARKGETMTDVAAACDITQAYVSLLEKGHRNPTLGVLDQIVSHLGGTLFIEVRTATQKAKKPLAPQDQEYLAKLADLVPAINDAEREVILGICKSAAERMKAARQSG